MLTDSAHVTDYVHITNINIELNENWYNM